MANPNALTEGGGRKIPYVSDEAHQGTGYMPLGDGHISMGAGRDLGTIPGASINGRVSTGAAGIIVRGWARFPDTFKPFDLTAVTSEQLIWDPASGKKFRILGVHLKADVETKLALLDGTGGTVIFRIGAGDSMPVTLGTDALGPLGILSTAANANLYVTSSASAAITGTVWGCEE